MKKQATLSEWEEETLLKMKGMQIYVTIEHVSASGMTRRMKFYYKNPDYDRLINVTFIIATICGKKIKNDALVVGGCGMDMIFSVLSSFNYIMAQRVTGKTLQELMATKECGERIYDTYYVNANNYQLL